MRDDYFPGDAHRRHHPYQDRAEQCGRGHGPHRSHHDDANGAEHHGSGHGAPHEHHDGQGSREQGDFPFPGGFGRRGFGPSFDPRGFDPAVLAAFGARGRKRASRGDIRAAILSLLADGPKNGYALIKAIAEKTDGLWKPSPGSVYPTLQQLVDEELVEAIGDGRRTDYELTDAGKAYVTEHQSELDAAWKATPGRTEADAALHESIGKLMGVVHQFRFASNDEQRKQAVEKIDELRKALYLILAE
ncbi:MAG TPA: PadR family transcriptional regulator [Humibacter sp.]|jgi:DNA-binding PadR family transcriptional regulator|nr:PadR family transcriptional regulator [Humibacter sp.]